MTIARLLICLLAFSVAAFANDPYDPSPVRVSLYNENTTVQPGHSFWMGVSFDVDPGWHTYWQNPGDSGMPLTLDWTLPEGWTVTEIQWPHPKKFTASGMIGYGYEGPVMLLAYVTPAANAPVGSIVNLTTQARWVACSDETCLPGTQSAAVQLKVQSEVPVKNTRWEKRFSDARALLPEALQEASAQRKDELIELNFQIPFAINPDANVYFCSQDADAIDAHFEPMVLRVDEEGGHKIALKQSGNASQLNGVLVIHHEDQTLAYAIDVPIEGGDQPWVSMNDSQETHVGNASEDFPMQDDVGSLGWALILAFAGGALLNLMPCVLPVISFKVMSFIKLARESRWLIFKHGIAFSLGVLVSFWVLAGALLALQAYGHAVGWGFQLQEPLFVGALAAVIFVFGLSLFGVFEIGLSVTSWAGETQQSSSQGRGEMVNSFLSGVLATAVATPCTGPFLGSAVGFAVTLPALQALLVFTFLGLGMSMPYLLLAAFPSLLRLMPKPGAWMETFKQLMGFMMMATVIWLAWVFGAQTGSNGIAVMLGAFFVMAIGCWIYGRWTMPLKSKRVRMVATCMAVGFLLLGGYGLLLASTFEDEPSVQQVAGQKAGEWEVFSPERVAELRAQGIPVLIDFTAKWCLICQANHVVLSTPEVDAKLNEKGVVRMKADWTRHDPVITEELRKFGRNSVPLYVLYDNKDAQPTLLPQVLTPEIVVEKLRDTEQASR